MSYGETPGFSWFCNYCGRYHSSDIFFCPHLLGLNTTVNWVPKGTLYKKTKLTPRQSQLIREIEELLSS